VGAGFARHVGYETTAPLLGFASGATSVGEFNGTVGKYYVKIIYE
jgi:hypothetical protein